MKVKAEPNRVALAVCCSFLIGAIVSVCISSAFPQMVNLFESVLAMLAVALLLIEPT